MKAYYGSLKYYHDTNKVAIKQMRILSSSTKKMSDKESITLESHKEKSKNTSLQSSISNSNNNNNNNNNDRSHERIIEPYSFWPIHVKEKLEPMYINIPFNDDSLIYRD